MWPRHPHHSTILSFHHPKRMPVAPNKPNSGRSRRGGPYKQTQFAPAGWAGEAVAGVYCAKQTQFTGRCRARLYKQTQLAGGARRDAVRLYKQTQFGSARPRGGVSPWTNKAKLGRPGVSGEWCRGSGTNKPNLAGRPPRPAASGLHGPVVQTKPIPRGRDVARRTNKPNLPSPHGQASPWLERIAPNKPNCPKRGTEAVSGVAAFGSPIIPVFHHSSPMRIVRNKANLRRTILIRVNAELRTGAGVHRNSQPFELNR
jgi:hypothetical protein